MGRLTVDGINPQVVEEWPPLFWRFGLVGLDLTCGFCRMSLRVLWWPSRATVNCPACGTRNLLERRRGASEPLE